MSAGSSLPTLTLKCERSANAVKVDEVPMEMRARGGTLVEEEAAIAVERIRRRRCSQLFLGYLFSFRGISLETWNLK